VSDDLQNRLSRWSQRKLAASRGAPAEDAGDKLADTQSPAPADVDANPAAEEEAVPALPPIESLTAESDFTVFLRQNVPVALKNAALRKLWNSDPVFANRDGLCDYDEDFNELLTRITPEQTGYKVGSGYLEKVEEAVAKLEPANDSAADKRIEQPTDVADGPAGAADDAGMGKSVAAGDDSHTASRRTDAADAAGTSDGPMEDKGN
jgi:Protein of unknown function (DUF3306)